jgi:hypothetical protein
MQRAETPTQLIAMLGGKRRCGAFFGVGKAHVWNWENREGNFPTKDFLYHQELLRRAGIDASPDIWFKSHRSDKHEQHPMERREEDAA